MPALLRNLSVAAVLAAMALPVASCTRDDSLLVLSASSAQDAVRELATSTAGDVDVVSGGSSALVRQLQSGVGGDVLITADVQTMRAAVDAGVISSDPVTFAASRLVVAVPVEQRAQMAGSLLSGFDFSENVLVLCSEPVPCGAAARAALDRAGVDPVVSSYEPSSRQALAKVALGVADVALVWRVDLESDDRVVAVSSEIDMPITQYRAAVVSEAQDPERASRFVRTLTSEKGQSVLAAYGFEPVTVLESPR